MAKLDEDPKSGDGGQVGQARAAAQPSAGQVEPVDPVALLSADHRKVEALFKQFESAADDQKGELIRQICSELVIHTSA